MILQILCLLLAFRERWQRLLAHLAVGSRWLPVADVRLQYRPGRRHKHVPQKALQRVEQQPWPLTIDLCLNAILQTLDNASHDRLAPCPPKPLVCFWISSVLQAHGSNLRKKIRLLEESTHLYALVRRARRLLRRAVKREVCKVGFGIVEVSGAVRTAKVLPVALQNDFGGSQVLAINRSRPIGMHLRLPLGACTFGASATLPEDSAEVELASMLLEVVAPRKRRRAPRTTRLHRLRRRLDGSAGD